MNTTTPSTTDHLNRHVIAQLLPIAVLILFVNSLVFFLFAKEKRLRKPPNYLLFSLAVCDFMNGLVNIPLLIIVMMKVFSPPEAVTLGFFVAVLHNMVVILVIYHIFAITVERYFSIARPFHHRRMATKSSVKIIVVIWMVAVLIAFLPFAWFRTFLKFESDSVEVERKIQTGHIIFCIVFVFLLPFTFIVYSQVVMFRRIRQGTFNRRNSSIHGGSVNSVKRCLIIFALMAFLNVVCWIPWYILSIFHNLWFSISEEAKTVLLQCSQAFLIIRYLTSIANPVLYTFFKRDFQDAFKTVILRRKVQEDRSLQGPLSIRNRTVGLAARCVVTKKKKDLEYKTVV